MIFDQINLYKKKAFYIEVERYIGSIGCFSIGLKEY